MGRQDSAVASLSYCMGAAVWGMHRLQVLPCQATGILGCFVALHARRTFVWKAKWSFACPGFRKMRIPGAWYFAEPAMRCQWPGFHKDVLQRPHDLFEILSVSYRQIYWGMILQHELRMDTVVQSPCHNTSPYVPNRLLHRHAASSKDNNVSPNHVKIVIPPPFPPFWRR